MNIGEKIRNLRKKKKISLRGLSAKAEISPSLLSQIETNKVDPSLSTLRKIAQSLDTPPLFFFLPDETLKNGKVIKKNQRRSVIFPEAGVKYQILHSDPQKKIGIHVGILTPGGATNDNLIPHAGEECLVVVEGNLTVMMNEEIYHLEEDDSIYFDSSVPHRLVNESQEPCRFFLIITPPRSGFGEI